MSKRRWQRGEAFTSVPEIVDAILSGHFVFVGERLQTAGWVQNWSLATIRGAHSRVGFYRAERLAPWNDHPGNGVRMRSGE